MLENESKSKIHNSASEKELVSTRFAGTVECHPKDIGNTWYAAFVLEDEKVPETIADLVVAERKTLAYLSEHAAEMTVGERRENLIRYAEHLVSMYYLHPKSTLRERETGNNPDGLAFDRNTLSSRTHWIEEVDGEYHLFTRFGEETGFHKATGGIDADRKISHLMSEHFKGTEPRVAFELATRPYEKLQLRRKEIQKDESVKLTTLHRRGPIGEDWKILCGNVREVAEPEIRTWDDGKEVEASSETRTLVFEPYTAVVANSWGYDGKVGENKFNFIDRKE